MRSEAICKHCGNPILRQDFAIGGYWVDVNGLKSCAPYSDIHEPGSKFVERIAYELADLVNHHFVERPMIPCNVYGLVADLANRVAEECCEIIQEEVGTDEIEEGLAKIMERFELPAYLRSDAPTEGEDG